MYDSQNLPLSPLKPVKKTIASHSGCIVGLPLFIIFTGIIFGLGSLNNDPDMGSIIREFHETYSSYIIWLIVGLWLVSLIYRIIYEYLYYRLYKYNFEEEHAEITKGIIARSTGHIKYERIQNVYVDQDFWDRVFGLFDVHYETAGEKSASYLHVDGLNKTNADKLIEFLNQKSKGRTDSDENAPSTDSPTSIQAEESVPTVSQEDSPPISRLNCPLSSNWLIGVALYALILAIFFGAVLFHVLPAVAEEATGNHVFIDYQYFFGIVMFLLLWFAFFIYFYIWFKLYNFEFNAEKGKIESGIVARSISFLYYDRIQNITLKQGILDRIFKIYDLMIETAGETSGTKFVIPALPKEGADKLQNFLLEKSKKYKKNL